MIYIPVTFEGSVNFKSCILRKIYLRCKFTVINMIAKPIPMCIENFVKVIPYKTIMSYFNFIIIH